MKDDDSEEQLNAAICYFFPEYSYTYEPRLILKKYATEARYLVVQRYEDPPEWGNSIDDYTPDEDSYEFGGGSDYGADNGSGSDDGSGSDKNFYGFNNQYYFGSDSDDVLAMF